MHTSGNNIIQIIQTKTKKKKKKKEHGASNLCNEDCNLLLSFHLPKSCTSAATTMHERASAVPKLPQRKHPTVG